MYSRVINRAESRAQTTSQVAVCCSVLQCDEASCSVLQCVVLAMICLTEVDVAYNHLRALPPQLKHLYAKKMVANLSEKIVVNL